MLAFKSLRFNIFIWREPNSKEMQGIFELGSEEEKAKKNIEFPSYIKNEETVRIKNG